MQLIPVVIASIVVVITGDEQHPPDLDRQAKEVFAWLDELEYPNLENRPFVELTVHEDRFRERDLNIYGFVTNETADYTEVFTLDLKRVRYSAKTSRRKIDISAFAKQCLGRVHPATAEERDGVVHWAENGLQHANFESGLTEKTLLTVLAWACEKKGIVDDHKRLIKRASRLMHSQYMRYTPDSLLACIKDEISFNSVMRVYDHLGDPEIPLSYIVAQIEWHTRHFPKDRRLREDKKLPEHVKILRRMIAEKRVHDETKPLESMAIDERVAELIYRLRYHNVVFYSDPLASIDVLGRRNEETPATPLMALGPVAVPQLIREVGNDTLTRSTGKDMKSPTSYVFTVGDVAEAILWGIMQDQCEKKKVEKEIRERLDRRFWKASRGASTHSQRVERLQEWWSEVEGTLSQHE